jgi:hypothetical protein
MVEQSFGISAVKRLDFVAERVVNPEGIVVFPPCDR